MTKKAGIIVCLFIVLSVIGFSVRTATSEGDRMLKVESLPLHDISGWGYEILVGGKIFIHQQFIPAIAGKKAFLTKEDAMKTASLVIKKLVGNQPPAITCNDLDSLKISL